MTLFAFLEKIMLSAQVTQMDTGYMCDIYKNYRKHEGPRRIMFIRKMSNLKLSDITLTKSNSEFLSEKKYNEVFEFLFFSFPSVRHMHRTDWTFIFKPSNECDLHGLSHLLFQ